MRLAPLALLASLPLLAAAPTRTADELRVVYPAGWSVVFEEREWSTTEWGDVSMKINGEDVPEEARVGVSMPSERQDKAIRFTSWLDAVEDGRPVGARRRFDELSRTTLEGDEEAEEKGKLAGRTVLLTASAAGGEVEARLSEDDEGPAVDEVYLSNHRLAFELERYLPERAVEVGDTWELEEAAVREILGVDGEGPTYFEGEASAEDEAMERALREGLKVKGSVEYDRREDVESQACAVLLISLQAEMSEADVDPEAIGVEDEGMETSLTMSLSMEGEERLWFALEAGRPVRSSAEWKGDMTIDLRMSDADTGMEIQSTMTADMRGGFEQSWTFEEER